MKNVRKFVAEDLAMPTECDAYKYMELLNGGVDLSDFAKSHISNLCDSEGYNGYYLIGGWEFNFRPYMKRFVCITDNGDSLIKYAFSEQHIYELYDYLDIAEVYEIPNNYAK